MERIKSFLAKYHLKESHIYLLELVPLIEMIWADEKNQESEINILYRYTLEHLTQISKHSPEIEVISEQDVNEFLNRFTSERPDPTMLQELRELCLEKIERKPTEVERNSCKRHILDYCLDIAAACVESYPYKFNERIVAQEKQLLNELFREFTID